jgi:formate dehydrogenase
VLKGGWNIADCVQRSYDLEAMEVGTVAAGRIGLAVLRRLKPFDVKLHYTDRHRLPRVVEKELDVTFHPGVASMVAVCDVVTIDVPPHPETEDLFDETLIAKMKRGAYLVNAVRGKICNREAIARALGSGQLAGYAGDVWWNGPLWHLGRLRATLRHHISVGHIAHQCSRTLHHIVLRNSDARKRADACQPQHADIRHGGVLRRVHDVLVI